MPERSPTLVAPGELRTDLLAIFEHYARLEVLLAPPGLLPSPGGYHKRLAHQPWGRLPASAAFEFRRVMLEAFTHQIDALPQTAEWEIRIRRWLERLRTEQARFLVRDGAPLHTRLVSRGHSTAVLAGPLLADGRPPSERGELDLELTGDAHLRARGWFEGHAAQAEDITPEIIEILFASWAGQILDPEDLYYKVLAEYFGTTLEGIDREADDNPMLDVMTNFQAEAYHHAKGILRRYGGVFLADVVGLGKTFIGLALLKYLQDTSGEHAVVVAPPAVRPAWEELAREHRVELQTLSHGKIEDIGRFDDREILVIDESHNFRNPWTQRYAHLSAWLRPEGLQANRKVILVSATPQNNSPKDVLHQIQLFPDTYTRLPFRGESMDTFFADVERGRAPLSALLQHVVVRRTRRFIQAAYPEATIRRRDGTRIPLRFPERISGEGQCLRYRIEDAYGGNLYAAILALLTRMQYPLYGLADYLHPDHADNPRFAGLNRTGRSLRGLIKILLLKRLESSAYAFQRTLVRLRERLDEAFQMLAAGQVRIRVGGRSAPGSEDRGDEVTGVTEEVVSARYFDTKRLEGAIYHDFEAIDDVIQEVRSLDAAHDAKLQRLLRYLRDRSPRQHRTVVFSQFADTVDYLSAATAEGFGRTAKVTGSTGNALAVARRFAPLGNRVDVDEADQIDLLIATDALSEGVNLQDADTLVNYDLHWNPVRLIQRAGRIDRIGSPNEEIHVASFLPERELEERLGLEAVLRKRIAEFLAVFGEDSRILPDEGEELDEDAVIDAYTGQALERADEEDDIDALGKHAERILALRRDDPDRYDRIQQLRCGRRSVSTSAAGGITALRVGWYWSFYERGEDGNPSTLDDLVGLDRFARHGRAGIEADPDTQEQAFGDLGDLVRDSRTAFGPLAENFRAQRALPRLDPAEEWVRTRLERYRAECLATRRPLVTTMLEWVLAGQHKAVLRRHARLWRREKLTPESVFHVVQGLVRRFPLTVEELGEEEIVGSVVGSGLRQ